MVEDITPININITDAISKILTTMAHVYRSMSNIKLQISSYQVSIFDLCISMYCLVQIFKILFGQFVDEDELDAALEQDDTDFDIEGSDY